MKKVLMTVLVMLTFLQAGITFGTGSRVFIYNANISVYGNLKNLGGVITPISTSKFSFVGGTQDTLTNVYTFPNLIINKPTGNLRLNNSTNNFLLTGNATLTQGNILTGTNTFELGASATVTGETATKYVVGTVKAARAVGTGSNTFGGIGYSLGTGTGDLGTVTVYRYSGDGNEVSIYGTEGIWRKWTVETSNAFSGTRSVTSNWFSNEDNGNNLTTLKVWKYEPVKSPSGDPDIRDLKKIKFDIENISAAKSIGIEGSGNPEFVESAVEDVEFEPSENDGKNLYWVEVDGATFNTASSPRTATYTINGATSYTICSASNAFADGAGTLANPYQIATLAQLNNVRNYPSAHFIQIANINASATTGWNSGAGWDPIANFTGRYNAQGYNIDSLFINRSATNYIGLFGYTTGATISNLDLTNLNITGYSYTGGLVGYLNSSSSVLNCSASGTVIGYSYVGGLTGYIRYTSSVQNSFAKGTVTGYSYCGGLAGRIYTTCTVQNCYSQADVTRVSGSTSTYIGGFAGYAYSSTISLNYSTGSIVYSGAANPADKGFTGYYSTCTFNGNFWNTETSGQTSTYGTGSATGIGKNVMRTLTTFTNAGWDYQNETVNGTDDDWGMNGLLNNGYPFLSWEGLRHRPSPFAGGIGISDEPFMVSSLAQMDSVRNWMSSSFLQINDIDASATSGWNAGAGWNPIGTASPYFTGTYNGGGHIISNLFYNRTTAYTGLFGIAYTGSVISNLGLVNINGTGNSYSGSIAGYVNGTMSNCFSTGTVRALSYIGGFTGYATTAAVIDNCYSKCYVIRSSGGSSTYTAGFIGRVNQSKVRKCYSTGSVVWEGTTNPTTKGFAGSVVTGGNYEMADNFWDMTTSGQTTTSGIATGKTTAEMKQQITFVNWDFTTPVWNIHTSLNSGYPYLNWEYRLPVEAPSNLALTVSGSDVILTWNAVTNATGYAVYSSTDPYGTFTLDGSGVFNGTQWTAPLTGTRYFYYITALNATKNYPLVIKVNEMK